MLTCKEASYLASKKLDHRLSLLERLTFLLHIGMCHMCRRYAKDIKKVHDLMKQSGLTDITMATQSVKLSEQSKDRIKQALNNAIEKPN